MNTPDYMFKEIAAKKIGKPYKAGSSGPNFYDCWGLVYSLYNEMGKPLPVSYNDFIREHTLIVKLLEGETLSKRWKKLDKPEDLCIVVFKRRRFSIHVGIWLDDEKKVIHATGQNGVVFESLKAIKQNRGLIPSFYKWQK